MRKIGDNIKFLLAQIGMTQAELARRIGMTTGGVNHYVKGHRTPSVAQLKKIARAMGVKVEDIIKDDALITTNDTQKELLRLVQEMSEDQQEAALNLLRLLPKDKTDQ